MVEIKNQAQARGEIAIYRTKDKKVQLEVKLERETVWLDAHQIALLFGVNRPAIVKHINNIYKTSELNENSTCSILEQVAADGKIRRMNFYNLDVIISVGYRVNSRSATQFRIWATNVLRKYLVDGYALNERRLKEQAQKLQTLQRAISLISSVKTKKELDYREALGLLEVIGDYSYALGLLDDYDKNRLRVSKTSKEEKFKLNYEEAIAAVRQLKKKFSDSSLFGQEKDQSFKSSISTIYQTFGKKPLYPSIEEKAANLLYFIVKNHSFVDGNKRIAASIFLWFLEKNGILYREDKTKRIADNALVALTLMIAESDPQERDIIVTLVVNLINKNN